MGRPSREGGSRTARERCLTWTWSRNPEEYIGRTCWEESGEVSEDPCRGNGMHPETGPLGPGQEQGAGEAEGSLPLCLEGGVCWFEADCSREFSFLGHWPASV